MRATRIALVGLLTLSAVLLLIGTAAAQQGAQATQNGTQANSTVGEYETIDGNTAIVSSSYDPMSQSADLTLYSRTLQQVVITDVSPYADGGVMERRTITLRPGQKTTIEMPVNPAESGFVGLSVDTGGTLYAEPLKKPGIAIGPPQQSDLLALFMGPIALIGAARGFEAWNARKRREGVTRIDG